MPSKLHLNISSKPACGRQLNNRREARAQLQDRVVLAGSYGEFAAALVNTMARQPGPKACKHCARVVGLLPPIGRRAYESEAADPELTDDELLEALREDEEESSDE